MKTREILFKNGDRAFHWAYGDLEFYIGGEVITLDASEVEKLRKYFRDLDKNNEYDYIPGRAS